VLQRDFADGIKVTRQLTLRQGDYLGGPDNDHLSPEKQRSQRNEWKKAGKMTQKGSLERFKM